MSSGGAESRVSIPNNVRQTIHRIREITGKQHTDEDIYTVLKECSMDPNETTQKLLFLDTFHVVQRKPRRKEISNIRAPEDFRSSTNTQGRGMRGVRGNYASQHVSSDAGGGRNPVPRRENGVGQRSDRGLASSTIQVLQKTKYDIAPPVTKLSSLIPNGPTNLSNGSSSPAHAPTSARCVIDVLKDCSTETNKDTAPPMSSVVADEHPSKKIPTFGSVIGDDLPKSRTNSDQLLSSGVPSSATSGYSSTSDPLLIPTSNSQQQSAVGSQRIVAEPNHNQVDNHLSPSVGDSELPDTEHVANIKMSSKLKAVEKGQVSQPPQSSYLGTHDDHAVGFSSSYSDQSPQELAALSAVAESEVAAVCVKSQSQSASDSNVSVRQHVTFPNHFQVPEALKNGLTFGSFDTNIGPSIKSDNPAGENYFPPAVENYFPPAVESSQGNDDNVGEHPSQNVTSIAHEEDVVHDAQPTPKVLERGPSEGNVSSGVLPQYNQVKQDIPLHSEGPQNPAMQNATNYSPGLMPGSQLVPLEAPEPQAQDTSSLPNFVDGNSSVVSTATPHIIQSTHNSIPVSPQPFPYFRHPYPPNYFPYGPYLSPFFMPPMHQFIGPNGLPQQPSAAAYLPAAAAGVKYSVPQFKAASHIGYGSHVGYGPGVAVSGSSTSTGGEDHHQLKENHIYTTGQMSEGQAVWFSSPGQDMTGLAVSSLYNLPPQVPYSSMHSAYAAGIYQQPSQTLAAPLQAVAAETQSSVYQQTQHARMNWNTNI